MSAKLRIERAGPLCTIQDGGRQGLLAQGISASGPMDRGAHGFAGRLAGADDGAGIEMTRAGLDLQVVLGRLTLGWAGGAFRVQVNGEDLSWPGSADLAEGDRLSITPGPAGNYGYLRFDGSLDLPKVLGSRSTNMRAKLGGLEGRALVAGDVLAFSGPAGRAGAAQLAPHEPGAGPIRFVWGIHAENFTPDVRLRFDHSVFRVTPMMDRMGVRLDDEAGVFSGASILSLVSDPILAGDIQILGDGTPIVLMRDHQPTGGYPRIGTIISADLDRFAQIRPGEAVAFTPVSIEHAQRLLRSDQS
ncbi:biotin-dependent carboxyltransferase family protein [Devosia sp. XK-2]|uniref:5-oxoprolinase subunit C family protein n=1 Tax=Devosia sp. XK-2 TaxID=3126689 RepID=UPI0030CAA199